MLVERLWPRGMKKEAVQADEWLKDVAPSTPLRKWYGHRVDLWDEFRERYRKELRANREAWLPLLEASREGTVTLLYSAHDSEHNSAVVLREYLLEQEGADRGRLSGSVRPAREAVRRPSRKNGKRGSAARGKRQSAGRDNHRSAGGGNYRSAGRGKRKFAARSRQQSAARGERHEPSRAARER